MAIWVFGDSYAEENHVDYQWYKQLGVLLDQPVTAIGQAGLSNDFISNQLRLHLEADQIQSQDWVIVLQTQFTRQWFFEDRPHLSNFAHHNDPTAIGMSRDEKRATDNYLKYLFNPSSLRFQTFSNSIANQGMCAWIAGCDCLNLPAFDNGVLPYNPRTHVTGTLTEWISLLEFATAEDFQTHLKQPGGDTRVNHLSEANHTRLAQKLADSRTTGVLDLTQGFDVKRQLTIDDFVSEKEFKEYLRAHTD